jgi:lysozyme
VKSTNGLSEGEMNLVDQLKRDEGVRLKPYTDSVGKLTIGIGRNIQDVGITLDEAEYMLANDIARVGAEVRKYLPWTVRLDQIRLAVLHNMCFMGIAKLLEFKKMLAAIEAGQWEQAAAELLDSKYAEQVGPRAHRLAEQIRTGEWQ